LTQPNGKVLYNHFVENLLLYRKHGEPVNFKILTVRGAIADATNYGFWTDIYVQSS